MIQFCIFDMVTGEIVKIGEAHPSKLNEQAAPGQAIYAKSLDPKLFYLPGGVATPRPVIGDGAGATTYDLNWLPDGGVLEVTDQYGVTTTVEKQDDTVELTDTGTYTLRSVSPFPFVDFEQEILI